MNSKNIEEYNFDNPNRITISASFGISLNRAKTISTTVDVPIKKTQTLSKTVAIPIKKARSVTSVNTIISNLERLAKDFGFNIRDNNNIVSLEDINLGDIEKLLEFANDPIFKRQDVNLKEAYLKFQNHDGTYTHKSFIVETVRVSDEAIIELNLPPAISIDNLQKILPITIYLLKLFSSSNFGKMAGVIILNILSSFLFEYGFNPIIDKKLHNEKPQEMFVEFLSDKRITINNANLLELPKQKSSIIENLPPGTLLTVIPDKTIPKSWLKVKVTLDQSEVEGYILRLYTTPVK